MVLCVRCSLPALFARCDYEKSVARSTAGESARTLWRHSRPAKLAWQASVLSARHLTSSTARRHGAARNLCTAQRTGDGVYAKWADVMRRSMTIGSQKVANHSTPNIRRANVGKKKIVLNSHKRNRTPIYIFVRLSLGRNIAREAAPRSWHLAHRHFCIWNSRKTIDFHHFHLIMRHDPRWIVETIQHSFKRIGFKCLAIRSSTRVNTIL